MASLWPKTFLDSVGYWESAATQGFTRKCSSTWDTAGRHNPVHKLYSGVQWANMEEHFWMLFSYGPAHWTGNHWSQQMELADIPSWNSSVMSRECNGWAGILIVSVSSGVSHCLFFTGKCGSTLESVARFCSTLKGLSWTYWLLQVSALRAE